MKNMFMEYVKEESTTKYSDCTLALKQHVDK